MNIELTPDQAAAYSRGESVEVTKPVERLTQREIELLNAVDVLKINRYVDLLAYVREFGGDWVGLG